MLGISQYTIAKVEDEAAIYTDTDSIYVQFDSAIDSIQGADFTKEEVMNLCINIDRHRLSNYFDQCFEKYGKLFNTNNRLKFKLENLSEHGIWLKKKNYTIKVAYEPNPSYSTLPKDKRYLVIKGLEPIKGSYPIWARKNLVVLTEFILERGKRLNIENDHVFFESMFGRRHNEENFRRSLTRVLPSERDHLVLIAQGQRNIHFGKYLHATLRPLLEMEVKHALRS